jgi:hypothetical protein
VKERTLAGRAGSQNVLFIAIDDLNDWTGMLKGNPQAKTAHMDKKRKQRSGFSGTDGSTNLPSSDQL